MATRLRHANDIKGEEYVDRARQSGMGSAFRNKKMRQEYMPLIQADAEAVSMWINLFSLHLHFKCREEAENPRTEFFTKTITNSNSFRKYFNQWKVCPVTNADNPALLPAMPTLKHRSHLMNNMLVQYYTAFGQTMFRNRHRRFKTYYQFFSNPSEFNYFNCFHKHF